MIVTLTPNPSLDWTLYCEVLDRGGVHRAFAQYREPSGKGVNVARALAANGQPARAVLPIGGQEGRELAALLDAEAVDFVGLPIAGSVRTNISLVEGDGTVTKINSPGPTLSREEIERLTVATLDAAAGAAWLVAAGSLPGGTEAGFYSGLCRRARRSGTRFALDSSGGAFADGVAAGPDVAKPNLEELCEVAGRRLRTVGSVIEAADELRRRGVTSVVVSMGSDGALLIEPDGTWHAQATIARVVSTVGAGDALLAGFLAAGGRGEGALREAVAWSAAAIATKGSGVPPITDAHRDAVTVACPDADRPVGRPAGAR